MAASLGVEVDGYGSYDEAVEAFRAGEVDAVLYAERNGVVNVTAVAPESSLQTTRRVVQLREILRELERRERLRRSDGLDSPPLPVPEAPRSSPFFGFTYTVLIPILMFLPVFISGSITSDSVTEEVERGTLELLRVTPTSDVEIVEGKMLAYGVLAPLQAGLWMVLLNVNGVPVREAPAVLSLVAALTVVAVVLGALLALVFGDRRRSQMMYSLVVILVFGAAAVAANPMNAVARLAVGSSSAEVYLVVAGYLVAALTVAAGLRWYMGNGVAGLRRWGRTG